MYRTLVPDLWEKSKSNSSDGGQTEVRQRFDLSEVATGNLIYKLPGEHPGHFEAAFNYIFSHQPLMKTISDPMTHHSPLIILPLIINLAIIMNESLFCLNVCCFTELYIKQDLTFLFPYN